MQTCASTGSHCFVSNRSSTAARGRTSPVTREQAPVLEPAVHRCHLSPRTWLAHAVHFYANAIARVSPCTWSRRRARNGSSAPGVPTAIHHALNIRHSLLHLHTLEIGSHRCVLPALLAVGHLHWRRCILIRRCPASLAAMLRRKGGQTRVR